MLYIPLLLATAFSLFDPARFFAVTPDAPREERPLTGAQTQVQPPLYPAAKDPFEKLFARQPRDPGFLPPFKSPPASAKRQVLCGLVVIPVDPNIDARMIVEPKDKSVKGTIRAIEPSVCRPE